MRFEFEPKNLKGMNVDGSVLEAPNETHNIGQVVEFHRLNACYCYNALQHNQQKVEYGRQLASEAVYDNPHD